MQKKIFTISGIASVAIAGSRNGPNVRSTLSNPPLMDANRPANPT